VIKLIRITEVPIRKQKFRIGLEIFLSEGFGSVWKNYWSGAEKTF